MFRLACLPTLVEVTAVFFIGIIVWDFPYMWAILYRYLQNFVTFSLINTLLMLSKMGATFNFKPLSIVYYFYVSVYFSIILGGTGVDIIVPSCRYILRPPLRLDAYMPLFMTSSASVCVVMCIVLYSLLSGVFLSDSEWRK